jgi:tricorn protease
MKKIFWLYLLLGSATLFAQAESRLLRFPAIYQNQIVFTYAGDLYTVGQNGGIARRLTSHDGFEMFARFSPDGEWIAFTGQYDGNTEVFIMPSQGGEPRRLTFTATLGRDDVSDRMGPNNIVMGWTPDGKKIVFRSRKESFNPFIGKLYTVEKTGGLAEPLPLPRGGFCSYSPDGKQLVYNRVFREFRTWKRYRGGMADDVWLYDFNTRKTENLTQNSSQDIIPMWHGRKIYFLSDRDELKRMNLYVYNLDSKETKVLTHFKEFDCKFPSLGPNAIVLENGGYIYRFDFASETVEQVHIQIANDVVSGRQDIKSVGEQLQSVGVAPDGKRALFSAHGDVFTVPVKYGATRNLTATSGVHERDAQWSPDGSHIAFISDKTGEDEILVIAQDGSASAEQITNKETTYKYAIVWSPDSKKILWADRRQRLRYVEVETRAIKEVAQATRFEIRDYTWSPDSKWIAYAKPEELGMTKVYLYSLETGAAGEVTDGWYDSYNPSFSSDGRYLFFVSDRDFNPIYSQTEWNHAYQDMARIYLVTLAKEVKSPFEPKSDEVTIKKEEAKKEDKKSEVVMVKVDSDGLKDRIVGLPIAASNYNRLTSINDQLYYLRAGSKDEKQRLLSFNFATLKETDLGQVDHYVVSADQKKMLVAQSKAYAIIDPPAAPVEMKEKLDLSQMEVRLDRQAEWAQIFQECWRQMREFFYAPNMHGVDWPAMRERYGSLVPYVRHRADLTYLLGEMIGELNVGHAYVGGGDLPQPRRINLGLLGAVLTRDPKSGFYQINKILNGQNWDQRQRSPLTEIGVEVHKNDYILAIDGKSTRSLNDPYEALVNTAGRQVRLTINSKPDTAGQHQVIVVPISDESGLYYADWVQKNIDKVTEATQGRVGYIHVPDMGTAGLNEFVKHFYPQLQKKALIIDVRGNGGGNVSPMLIERLRREITMIEIARNTIPSTQPFQMIWGPKVCLIDEFSASDGDLFPYQFKQLKMGKLIGKRTWGGVVGIRGTLPLLDGGFLNRPEFSRYDLAGKEWVIEGTGVEPDIYVDNDPANEYRGVDEQLNKAIEVILTELKTEEKSIPPAPPYPQKN